MKKLLEKLTRSIYKAEKTPATRSLAMLLAVCVVFTTTYSLILPAITMDANTAETSPDVVLEGHEESQQLAEAEPAPAPVEAAPEPEPVVVEEPAPEPEPVVVEEPAPEPELVIEPEPAAEVTEAPAQSVEETTAPVIEETGDNQQDAEPVSSNDNAQSAETVPDTTDPTAETTAPAEVIETEAQEEANRTDLIEATENEEDEDDTEKDDTITVSELTYQGKDYTVTAVFDTDITLPENAKLIVPELLEKKQYSAYAAYYARSVARMLEDRIPVLDDARYFQPRIEADGTTISIPTGVAYSYEFNDKTLLAGDESFHAIGFAENDETQTKLFDAFQKTEVTQNQIYLKGYSYHVSSMQDWSTVGVYHSAVRSVSNGSYAIIAAGAFGYYAMTWDGQAIPAEYDPATNTAYIPADRTDVIWHKDGSNFYADNGTFVVVGSSYVGAAAVSGGSASVFTDDTEKNDTTPIYTVEVRNDRTMYYALALSGDASFFTAKETETDGPSERVILSQVSFVEVIEETETGTETETETEIETETEEAGVASVEADGVTITPVNGETLPADAEASAAIVDGTDAVESVEELQAAQQETTQGRRKAPKKAAIASADAQTQTKTEYQVFDISLANVDEAAYEGGFAVEVKLTKNIIGKDFKLYHVHDGVTEELHVDTVGREIGDSGLQVVTGFAFVTENFSEFVLRYTVDFEYVDGDQKYAFSIPGGSSITAASILEKIGVAEDVEQARGMIASVSFSDETLVKVEKVGEDKQVEVTTDSTEELTMDQVMALDPNSAVSIDKVTSYINVKEGDWLLTSVAPFTSQEELKISLVDERDITINVTDAQVINGVSFDNDSSTVKLTDIATVRASASKTVTQNEQERNASFDITMGIMLSKNGLEALQSYVTAYEKVPALVYDFSSALKDENGNFVATVTGGTQDLKENGQVVGTVTITPDGKAIIQYNDADWVKRKTAIGANISFELNTQENNIPSDDKWDFIFPDSNTVEVHYKSTTSTEAKKYVLSGDGESGYTATYTAKFTNTANMNSLTFTDELGNDDLQTLNASSIRISKDGQDVTSFWTINATSKGFTATTNNSDAAKSGEYVVTYTTSITAAQYAQMQEGTSSWETNKATWNVNGNKDIPGGETSFNIEKPKTPEPPVTVEKSSDKENQEVTPGSDIWYEVSYKTTKIAGLQIMDQMTDIQVLDSSSVSITIDGAAYATPSNFLNYNNDGNYNLGMTNVYDYAFPSDYNDDGNEHTITVRYKATVIDQATAKANNVFDAVSVDNVGREGRYYTQDKTTSTVTYDKEVIHSVDKSVTSSAVTTDGKWEPGATLTYTIKIGDGTTDLSGVRVVDRMTDLQRLNAGSVQIKYGDSGAYSPLTEGLVYNDDGQYSTNDTNVLDLVLPQSAGYGPVFITYTTTVLTQQQLKDAGLTIYDDKQVRNTVDVGEKGHDGTEGTVPYPSEPKYPLTKTVTYDEDQTNEDSGNVKLGGTVHYHVEFGDENIADMSGAKIRDDMTDIQKLVGDVTVTLSEPLAETVTFADGTVWEKGGTEFTMPTATSGWAEDGVAWAAYFNDGRYTLNDTARVFYFKLPDGVGKGPVKIDYNVQVISEDEAKAAGILDVHKAYNTAVSGNNTQTTEYPIDFPKDVKQEPTIEKKWVKWDFDNKAVYWDIIVDKTADSAFPLENVEVWESIDNHSKVTSSETNNYQVKPSDYDMLGAVVTTESGTILELGVDYTVDKGSATQPPRFIFPEINEKITIRVAYSTPYSIIDGYFAHNRATLIHGNDPRKDADAENTYHAPEFSVGKSGELIGKDAELGNGKDAVIKWVVKINPTEMVVKPDPEHVNFVDEIPEGLNIIDYTKWTTSKIVDKDNPTLNIGTHGGFTLQDYLISLSSGSGTINVNVDPEDHSTAYYGSALPFVMGGVFNGEEKGEQYIVTYYTVIDDDEWERISSSASGSKTYDNVVTINIPGYSTGSKAEVTVSSENYISKTDTTQHGDYEGKDGKTHTGVVIASDDLGNITKYDAQGDEDPAGQFNKGSNNVSYKIEVNPNAMALNRVDAADGETVTYEPIVLTDRIDTNMDFDPDSLKIYVYGTPGDASSLHEMESAELKTAGITITYNDDSRLLTISGLADKTAYRVVYHNVVRAQGEDTFTNTATLTGGGSHSSTTSERHKFETFNDDSSSYDMGLTLKKIEETNITRYLPNVTFELHELTLESDPSTMTDAEWEALYTATNTAGYVGEDRFKIKENGDKLLDTVVTDDDHKGAVTLPTGSIKIKPMTLYYWIETKNDNEGYKAENTPHYFVLYPEMEIVWVNSDGEVVDEKDGIRTVKIMLSDAEKAKQQRFAWALDNATQAANDITVASLASGASWSVTNLETKYTNIAAQKVWEGDKDNLYETRPDEGIKLTLWQKEGEDGEWVVYSGQGTTNPVIVRGSKYQVDQLDENGNVVMSNGSPVKVWTETWPNTNWVKLPAYSTKQEDTDGDGVLETVKDKTYYYKVIETPVSEYSTDYTTTYKTVDGSDLDLLEQGIPVGTIIVTNTYIPPTTKISVHKNFAVSEGTELPEQIVVHLYRITKDADGNISAPRDYGYVKMLNAQNNWTETFTGLPTRDADGNTYSYTVVEDTDALEDGGFTYTLTEYELDGQVDFGGLVSGTVEITNHGPGSLKIEKNVTINGKEVEEGDTGADGTYTFHILKDGVEITDTYEDEEGNTVPKSPVTITIENGVSNSVVVSGLDAGEYTIHEDEPTNGTSLTSGNDVKVKVVGGVDEPTEVGTATFTNNAQKNRVKVEKTWVNANRDADGNQINGTNNDWPRGVTIEVQLQKKKSDGTGEPVAIEGKTVILSGARQSYIFDDLEDLPEGWEYTVSETIIGAEGRDYQQVVNEIDEEGTISIINAENTKIIFTKKWENTTWNQTDKVHYNRQYIRILVKLHRYYYDENGERQETEYTAEELAATGNFSEKVMYGYSRHDPTWGNNPLNETTVGTGGADTWTLYWPDLATVGEVNGKSVAFFYEAEETKLYYSHDVEDYIPYDEQDHNDPYGQYKDFKDSGEWGTVYSDDHLTATNRYMKDTSVEVEKIWSDGANKHTNDQVEVTLYRSKIGPDGTGTLYTGNISVNSWKLADGTSASGAGSIKATVKLANGKVIAEETLSESNNWTASISNLREGYDYTVTFSDATGITSYTVSSENTTISKDTPNLTLACVVPPSEYNITVKTLQSNQWEWNQGAGEYKVSSNTIEVYYVFRSTTEENLSDYNVDGATKTISAVSYNNENLIELRFRLSNIKDGQTITVNFGDNGNPWYNLYTKGVDEVSTSSKAGAPRRRAAATVTPSEVTVPDMPDETQLEVVTTDMVANIKNPIQLNFGDHGTYGKWNYSWAGLPETDSYGYQWFYYVKETNITDTVELKDVRYDISYSDVKPRTVTKVKINNIVQQPEGKLVVTKKVTGYTGSKRYNFYVETEDGKYIQNTSGEIGANKKWFSVAAGDSVTFDPVIAGTYTVVEDTDDAKVSGYKLTATADNDGVVTVVKDGEATVTLNNDYEEEKGSLRVKKTFNGLTYAELTAAQKTALEKVSFTVKNSSNETVATIYLKVDSSNMDADLTKTISDLKPGVYTVVETIPNDSVSGGYEYKETTVAVSGGTGTPDNSVPSSTATVVANQTVTVTFDNKYEQSTGKIIVKKTFKGVTGSDLTTLQNALRVTITGKDVGGSGEDTLTLSWSDVSGDGKEIDELPLNEMYQITEAITGTEAETILAKYNVASDTVASFSNVEPTADGTTKELVNSYTEKPGELDIKKEVSNGSPDGKTFTFEVELKNADGTAYTGKVKVQDSTRTTATEVTPDTNGKLTVTVSGTGTATITEIPAGTTYTVTEPTGNLPAGWTQDSEITYSVDADQTIEAGETETATVTNKYDATGTATFSGTKTIRGRNFKAGDKFTVKVQGANNAPMPGTTAAGTDYTKEFTLTDADVSSNATSYAYALDTINFTLADVANSPFTYTVTESAASMADTTKDSTSYTVTVTISDKGDGTLNVEKSSNATALNFTNTFDNSTTAKIKGTKEMKDGSTPTGTYTFNIAAKDPTTAPMPASTQTTNSGANFEFGNITYPLSLFEGVTADADGVKTRTFKYNVTEDYSGGTAQTDGSFIDANHVKYDTSTKEVTVIVTYNTQTGAMEATVSPAQTDLKFTNEQLGKISIQKTFSGNAASNLTDAQKNSLTFRVTGTDYDHTFTYGTDDTDSNATWNEGTLTITNLPIGTTYTVVESGDGFVDGENTPYIHTATMKVGGETATGVTSSKDGNTIVVDNKYDTAKLEVTKTVSGDLSALPTGKTITFTISGDGLTEPITKIYPTDFTNGKLTLTHKDGIKLGTEYTVTESGTDMNLIGYTRTTTVTGTSTSTFAQTSTDPVRGSVTTDSSTGEASISFDNKYEQEKIDVPVEKKWVFAQTSGIDSSDVTDGSGGKWPDGVTVTVTLYSKTGDDEPATTGKTVTLSKSKTSDTFTNLPKFDGENEITYSVVETGVDGVNAEKFTTAISGEYKSKITITNTEKEAGLTITKSFTGATLTEAEKNTITFTVKKSDGSQLAQKTYAEFTSGSWTLTQADGIRAGQTYTVVESNADIGKYTRTTTVSVNGADATTAAAGNTVTSDVLVNATTGIGNIVVTNNYTKETTEVEGTKTWIDKKTHDNENEITLILKRKVEGADDSTYETVTEGFTLTWTGNNYKYTGLDKYVSNHTPATSDDEKAYVYKVEEQQIAGYKSEADGNNFTNTELTEIRAKKTWNGEDTWKNGMFVTFTVEQYKEGSATAEAGFETTVDANANEKSVTISSQQTVTWNNLPKYYLDGTEVKEYTYQVKETAVSYKAADAEEPTAIANYRTVYTVTGEGAGTDGLVTINNADKTVEIEVTKSWTPSWPDDVTSVTVALYQKSGDQTDPVAVMDGENQKTVTIPKPDSGEAKASFTNLPKYDANGNLITYSVKETKVTMSIGGTSVDLYDTPDEGQFSITDVFKAPVVTQPGTTYTEGKESATVTNEQEFDKLSASKVWAEGSPANHAPNVNFRIYRVGYYTDGETQKPASEGWYGETYTITGSTVKEVEGLPKKGIEIVNGSPKLVTYEYHVVESPVEGYYASYEENGLTFTITNTPVTEASHKTELEVKKDWKDSTNEDAAAAHEGDTIEFKLTQKAITTGYVPVTVVYQNANGAIQTQQELFVKKGATLTFTFAKGSTLFRHYVEMTVGSSRPTEVGGYSEQYTFTTGAINSATTIMARLTWNRFGGRDIWGSTVQDIGAAYQWTHSVISNQTLYKDYTSFYDAMKSENSVNSAVTTYTLGKDSIQVGGEEDSNTDTVDPYTDAITGDWAAKFTELPQFQKVENNYLIYLYEISELSITHKGTKEEVRNGETTNYTVTVDGGTITNTEKPVSIEGTKTWIDDVSAGKQGATRPADLEIKLYKVTTSGEGESATTTETEVTLQSEDATAANYLAWTDKDTNNWKYTITKLPRFDEDGNVITYKVKETVPDNYKAANEEATGTVGTNGNITGADFTNTQLTQVSVTKKWTLNDTEMEDSDDNIPSITVQLFRKNGGTVEIDSDTGKPVVDDEEATPYTITRTLKSGSTTEYEWNTKVIENLDKYYMDGTTQKEYEYYFVETAVNGYTTLYKAGDAEAVKAGSAAAVNGGGEVTITNAKYSVALPETGGIGTNVYHVGGSIIAMLSVLLIFSLWCDRRRRQACLAGNDRVVREPRSYTNFSSNRSTSTHQTNMNRVNRSAKRTYAKYRSLLDEVSTDHRSNNNNHSLWRGGDSL